MTAVGLVFVGVLRDAGAVYLVGTAICLAVLLAENIAVRTGDLRKVGFAFGVMNGVVSLLFFLVVCLEVAVN